VRCDVNLSLRASPDAPLGTRSETKNVNSLRSVERAVIFEVRRHAALLAAGDRVVQETRHFHEDTATSTPGREKSDAEDYRYFPEPDLVPVAPDAAWVEQLRAGLPELPAAHRKRLQEEWGLTDFVMQSLVNAGALGVVEATVAAGASDVAARKWWMGDLARAANVRGVELTELPMTPADVARLDALVTAGTLNDTLARQVVEGVLAGEGRPDDVVAARGLQIVSDEGALTEAVDDALAANPHVAERIRGGKVAAAGAIVGAVMKATGGQANAARVRELVLERVAAGA
jgi:aspartyl-tRNA(Asn)/glutamyl-tRNA(Gln) amidotransferase subunit B